MLRVDDVRGVTAISYLWVSQSADDLKIPMISDLPMNVRPKLELKDAVRAALGEQKRSFKFRNLVR